VLLGEHGADQADDRGSFGEDADHVGAATDFPIQPFVGLLDRICTPQVFRVGGKREDVGPGRIKVSIRCHG
jgi:hypothetical protein